MNIPAIGGSTATTSNAGIGAPQAVDYQSFLRLLVAQMKNQDPTSPMESTDYVAQLATFSQVEQSVQMNNKLEAMLQASTLSQATGLIGRQIETMDGKASGIVRSVELYSDGAVLVLESGMKVPMGAGVIISDASAPPVETPDDTDASAGDDTAPDEQEA